MKKLFWINPLIFTAILLLTGCKKEQTADVKEYKVTHYPVVKTLEVTNLTDTTATLNGTVNAFGLSTIVTFEYDTTTSYGNSVTASQSPVTVDGITNVSADISGLDSCSIYHFRIKAENSLWTNFYGAEKILNMSLSPVTDVDLNTYHAIRIGSQVWMQENLKTIKYSNGDLIGTTTPATLNISGESTPKYQWASDGNESNVAAYGRFYTFYVVTDIRNVCPTGWHVPTDGEWTILTDYLINNGYGYPTRIEYIGKSMADTSGWYQGSNNSSGFTALPSGYRESYGNTFSAIGSYCGWWSSTESSTADAYYRSMNNRSRDVFSYHVNKKHGFSVRCVRN